MRFNSPLGNCQSQPSPSGVPCPSFVYPVEAIEYALGLILRNSRTLVADYDSYKSEPIWTRFTALNVHVNRGAGWRELHCIVEQIDDCHPQKAAICRNTELATFFDENCLFPVFGQNAHDGYRLLNQIVKRKCC